MKTEAGEETWLGKKGDYKGKKISRMTSEPEDVNPEDEEKKKVDVTGAGNKTPTMVAKMSAEGDTPNFGGAATEGDQDEDDAEGDTDDDVEGDDELGEEEEDNDEGGGGKKTDDCVEAAKKRGFEEHDPPIHIADNCKTAKELCENLVIALHAINHREESLDQDDASDEAMQKAHQEPQMVAMSAAVAKNPTFRAMQLSLQATQRELAKIKLEGLEKRFGAIVAKCPTLGKKAALHMGNLAKKQMSLGGDSGDPSVLKAIAWLEAAEEIGPSSDLYGGCW